MSRAAIDYNTSSYGGMSRIPRRMGNPWPVSIHSGAMDPENQERDRKLSRLEQMQAHFQKQMLRQKEEKMINMYEENQQRALQKVNQNKGVVRDFFNERRAANSGGRHHAHAPSIEHMYQQKRQENQYNTYGNQNRSMAPAQNYRTNSGNGKASAGRDRSNLLAPINRNGNGQENPFGNKPRIVRPKTFTGLAQKKEPKELNQSSFLPKSAPNGTDGYDLSGEDTPPPNPRQLQHLQQKRKLLQNKQVKNTAPVSNGEEDSGKLTDFQKWQIEQNRNRELRLQKQRERMSLIKPPVPATEDEGYEEEGDTGEADQDMIKQKQQELLAQIEAQQQELDRMRNERQRQELEEESERERRAKLERERRRKEEAEERERRKQEEEERMQQRLEEERRREAERQKPRRTERYEYEESDGEENYNSNQTRQPAPPPQPKPANRRTPKRVAKTSPPPRSPSPPRPAEDHTAFYAQADQLEGAFENTGALKACYNCGRKFAVDRIQKHEKFCKNATKKRKVLDTTKIRTAGTDMEQYVGKKAPKPKPKKSNWRTQHQNFIEAIRYAKKVKEIEEAGGSLADLPPPPRTENPDYVQCPTCNRKFNQTAAERHIPHCKNARSRPAPLKRK